jgi:hypothetical protein
VSGAPPLLPAGFGDLEPFVSRWAVDGTARRAALRSASTVAEREAFFAAAGPRLDDALASLDAKAFAAYSPADQRLMDLMLSLAHVALAVEIQGPDEVRSAPWRDRMRIDRSTADEGVRPCSN